MARTATDGSGNRSAEDGLDMDQTSRLETSRLEFEPVDGVDYADLERVFLGTLCSHCQHRITCDQGCGFQEEIVQFLFPLEEVEDGDRSVSATGEEEEGLDDVMEIMLAGMEDPNHGSGD